MFFCFDFFQSTLDPTSNSSSSDRPLARRREREINKMKESIEQTIEFNETKNTSTSSTSSSSDFTELTSTPSNNPLSEPSSNFEEEERRVIKILLLTSLLTSLLNHLFLEKIN